MRVGKFNELLLSSSSEGRHTLATGHTPRAARHHLPSHPFTESLIHSLTTDRAEIVMSKGMDQKKSAKKQPTKTLKEKREAKKAKKQ